MRLRKRVPESGLEPSPAGTCCLPAPPLPIPAGDCGCSTSEARAMGSSPQRWLLAALPLGLALYASLEPLAHGISFGLLGLKPGSRLGEAVAFFLYDAPKVLLLLAAATFLVAFLQSWLDPDRTRLFLARQRGTLGNLLASLFGIVTPFCSCSAVPLFIGFVRAGVPLGVTFSYLVAAPMINEVALVLLLALFGWKTALLYAATGVSLAMITGWVLGWLPMESSLEPWVQEARTQAAARATRPMPLEERLALAVEQTRTTVRQVWPWALIGIGVGAWIHGYLPEGLLARFMGRQAWWSVPFAVAVGVPLYAGTAVVLPLVQTLLAKGAALGTALAFMMAVTALSLPEMILLRRVLRLRLLLMFVGIVTLGILGVGYLFNFLM